MFQTRTAFARCRLPAHRSDCFGQHVAASRAFVDEVRRINRKFLAIDMEAAGVTLAATERVHRVPWLVVRGISDRADENKKTLDDEKGAWRRYCVRNAIGFLQNLLAWERFSLPPVDSSLPS